MSKTVIITGGNKGIGWSITEAFLQDGYEVIVGSRSGNVANVQDSNLHFIEMDVRIEEGHVKLVKKALDKTGRLDCYVNNSGISDWCPIENIDEAFFNKLIETNLKGAFWGCKSAVAALIENGSIINISSIAGKRGSSNNTVYCASKFGMNGLTQALAKEVGSKGIRVNAICPVLIKTDGLVEALEGAFAPAKGNVDQFLSDFTDTQTALDRLPTGQEVGQFCLYLASEKASAITGQCINVDCGVLPQ